MEAGIIAEASRADVALVGIQAITTIVVGLLGIEAYKRKRRKGK